MNATSPFFIAIRNGLIIGFYIFISQLMILGRIPNPDELYVAVLPAILAIATELMNTYKLQPPKIDKSELSFHIFQHALTATPGARIFSPGTQFFQILINIPNPDI